jgi:hypothetical protein
MEAPSVYELLPVCSPRFPPHIHSTKIEYENSWKGARIMTASLVCWYGGLHLEFWWDSFITWQSTQFDFTFPPYVSVTIKGVPYLFTPKGERRYAQFLCFSLRSDMMLDLCIHVRVQVCRIRLCLMCAFMCKCDSASISNMYTCVQIWWSLAESKH